ncbi:MAG: polysaccharide pyruvyl transferase family protein [Acidimicrobiia bacterium]|nr:polysaccharide pyruvyl transferase family protein [Acidimicrobiia bacterium]
MAEERSGPARRARDLAGRAKAAPSRIEWLYANQETVNEALRVTMERLDAVAARLEQLEARISAGDRVGDADAATRLDALDASIAGHAQVLQRVVATPARNAELARLRGELGPAPALRPGLSVFTICWNHADLLPTALASGLALLDHLDPTHAGELLVLDDRSSDASGAVADEWAARDGRIRVIHAATNLGLARARNALLHAVGTSHAFQLDADNTAVPSGVAAVYEIARRYDAAFTYGTVMKVDLEGNGLGVMSNEPVSEPWLRSNYIDTMAVVDVDVMRRLGGWPEDPVIEHVDDWALVHRIAVAGELIGFVPVIAGRYLALSNPFHLSVPDSRLGPDRIARTFDPTGRLRADDVAAFSAHPDLGLLWASPAAVARRPDLAPPPPRPADPPPAQRLLVVAPGGVENVGDDAITVAGLERLATTGLALDVITDGDRPVGLPPSAEWLGTLHEAVWGLRPEDLEDDEQVRAAAARVEAGRLDHRPVDPTRYRAAIFLGGGSLTSLWGDLLVAPRAVLGSALRRAGVPYVLSGQGAGPLDDVDRALIEQLAAGARSVAARDQESAALLGAGATVTGDDALLLGPAVRSAAERDEPYVVLSLRAADYVGTAADELDRLASEVDAFAVAEGLTVVGVSFNDQPGTEEVATLLGLARAASPRAARWRVLDHDPDPRRVAALLAGAHAVVAQSFHAALLSLAAGVPAVLGAFSPYYVAKADGLRAATGLPAELVVRPGEPLDLRTRFDAVTAALAAGALETARTRVTGWWGSVLEEMAPGIR